MRKLLMETSRQVEIPPRTFQEAAVSLVDVLALRSRGYRDAVVRQPRRGFHPLMRGWVMAMGRELRQRGAPWLWSRGDEAEASVGCAVDFAPVGGRDGLPAVCWELVRAVGDEVARRRHVKLLPVDDGAPWHWVLDGWERIAAAVAVCEIEGVELSTNESVRFAYLDALGRVLHEQREGNVRFAM